jgi:hypothetical protein
MFIWPVAVKEIIFLNSALNPFFLKKACLLRYNLFDCQRVWYISPDINQHFTRGCVQKYHQISQRSNTIRKRKTTTSKMNVTNKNREKICCYTVKLPFCSLLKEILMVSVLPAHIALEMKTEMLRKTRKAQMKSLMINHEINYENPANVIFSILIIFTWVIFRFLRSNQRF